MTLNKTRMVSAQGALQAPATMVTTRYCAEQPATKIMQRDKREAGDNEKLCGI